MGIAYSVSRHAVNIAAGNQAFTGSLGGLSPKLVLLRWVRATADDTPVGPAYYCRGMTDGVTSGCTDVAAEDAVASSVGRMAIIGGAAASVDCARFRRATNTSDTTNLECALRWVSFTANTVTLNVRIAPPVGYLLEVTMIGGSDFTGFVDDSTLSIAAAGTSDRTGMGVPLDAAVILSNGLSTGAVTTGASIFEGYFAASPHSGRAWAGSNFGAANNPASVDGDARDDCNKATLSTGVGRITLSQLPTGFRITAVDAVSNRLLVACMAFNGKALAWAGLVSTAVVLSPPQSLSAPRIRPELAIAAFSRRTAANGKSVAGDSSVHGGGTWTPAAQFGASVSSKHGVTPTVAKVSVGQRFIHIAQEDGTLASAGSPAAGDALKATADDEAQGLTLTYAGTSNAARLVPMLLIGPEFVIAPDPVVMPLVVPTPTVRLEARQQPSPVAMALVVPSATVVLPERPSPVALMLAVPTPVVVAPPVVIVPPELPPLTPLYQEACTALMPRGLAWPRRTSP